MLLLVTVKRSTRVEELGCRDRWHMDLRSASCVDVLSRHLPKQIHGRRSAQYHRHHADEHQRHHYEEFIQIIISVIIDQQEHNKSLQN